MSPDASPSPAVAEEGRRRGLALHRRAFLASLLAALPAEARAPLATPFALPRLDGPLKPLLGFEIHREALGFGGLSGLHLAPDLSLTAVSDLGRFAEFSLRLDPAELRLRRAGHLGDGAGRPLPRGFAGDAEALARTEDGRWLVAFERWHRIRAYADLAGPGSYVEAPPGLERAPINAGLESLAVLADGRWLAIAEEMALPGLPGATAAWLGGPGAWRPAAYRPAFGFAPVDAAPLPDGGALVLERSFSMLAGFGARLCRLSAAALRAPMLEPEELLRFTPPLPIDNYEAVAVGPHDGRLLVAIASDDNENRLQRSLLLMFELAG